MYCVCVYICAYTHIMHTDSVYTCKKLIGQLSILYKFSSSLLLFL